MHVFRVSYKAGRREGCASVSGQAITLAEPVKDGQGYRGIMDKKRKLLYSILALYGVYKGILEKKMEVTLVANLPNT